LQFPLLSLNNQQCRSLLHLLIPAHQDHFVLFEVVKFWSDLHGLITLCNSRLFHEVLDDVDAFVKERTSDMIKNIIKLKQSLNDGEKLF
ncbi:MAG: hypothetical protein QMD11_09885, partial [Smithella sp.]|nr:hypothetical protein [Smithella sp.]